LSADYVHELREQEFPEPNSDIRNFKLNLSKSHILKTIALISPVLIGMVGAGSASAITIRPADTVGTFNVVGIFSDNATLSGTLEIDTTVGKVMSADLTISSIQGNFTDITGQGVEHRSPYVDLNDGGSELVLDFVLPNGDKSLVGYAGGTLCDASTNCCAASFYRVNLDPQLNSGSVSPASTATPEPGTNALMGGGLIVVGLTLRKRFAK